MEAVFLTSGPFRALNPMMFLQEMSCMCVYEIQRHFKDTRDLEDTRCKTFNVKTPNVFINFLKKFIQMVKIFLSVKRA